jgi:hypothetical protein
MLLKIGAKKSQKAGSFERHQGMPAQDQVSSGAARIDEREVSPVKKDSKYTQTVQVT